MVATETPEDDGGESIKAFSINPVYKPFIDNRHNMYYYGIIRD